MKKEMRMIRWMCGIKVTDRFTCGELRGSRETRLMCTPHMLRWAHPSPHPKWQVDQFINFCRTWLWQTDRETTLYCVCNNLGCLLPLQLYYRWEAESRHCSWVLATGTVDYRPGHESCSEFCTRCCACDSQNCSLILLSLPVCQHSNMDKFYVLGLGRQGQQSWP